ncbi:MAG: hypothetical protein EBS83_15540, partial [Planctomycetia bacterium]|nr:hypothetical protein [Planctomycetia bacterium]
VELNGSFNTTGFQNYAGPITLLGDTSLNPTQLSIGGSVTGNDHNLTLSQTSGAISLSGSTISSVDQFVVATDSSIGGSITAASVDFQGNVRLTGNAAVVAAGAPGPISFGGTVVGGFDLSANGSTVTFSGAVGGTTSLGNLTTVGSTAAYVTAPITTTGSQTYNGQLVLNNSVTANASQFDALGGIDGGGGYNLAVTAGTSTLAGVSNVGDLSVTGSTSLDGTIATSGNQSYSGGVTLLGNATVTATNLSVGGVVDGDGKTLTVTPAAGQIGINGLAATNLTELTVTGDAAIAGSITTIGGNQAYQGNVTLGGATELGGTAATFASSIEGAGNDLTINFTQTSTVDGFNSIHNFTSLGAVELNGS